MPQDSDPAVVEQLPETAQRLINASADLYARVKRLDEGQLADEPAQSPARALMGRLERDLSGIAAKPALRSRRCGLSPSIPARG